MYHLLPFHGRVFLQILWKYELKWDECLPELLCQEWNKILEILKHLTTMKITHFIGMCEWDAVYEVLTFCDTSMKSYAAVVYLRIVSWCGVQNTFDVF